MTVVVVGAGLSGLACARAVADAGHDVIVRECGHTVGGRFTSRHLDGRPVDLGAAYFTVSDPAFEAVVADWHRASLAQPWTTTFTVYDGSRRSSATGPLRWAAPEGLRSLAEHLAADLPVRLDTPVVRVTTDPAVDGEPVDAVALCMPGPAAERLLPGVFRAQAWDPVLSAVLRYPARTWPDFHGAFVNDHPVLTTVCDDGDRRGDRAPVLVAHTTGGLARTHRDDPAAAGAAIADAVGQVLNLRDRPSGVHVHRWGLAKPAEPPPVDVAEPFELAGRVGLAGDIFGTPRAQTAWLSGRALGVKLAALLS